MMEKTKKYLSDILTACGLISGFLDETTDFESYLADLKTQSAVERQLVIIGEALNKLRNEGGDLEIENGRQIIAFRNRLVHAYDSIDNSIVWLILKRYLPELQSEVSEKLNDL